jgi:4-hydroxythreonine-4-phosphate dehydrogenase
VTNARPLAVSMGDPAGVGPEIVVKAWAQKRLPAFFAIGDPGIYERAFVQLGMAPAVSVIQAASAAAGAFAESLPVLAMPLAARETPGRPESANAPAVIEAIRRGAALCLAGEAAALVTCPIAKAVLYEAGFAAPGHTEFIADLTAHAPMTGPRGPVMMLAGGTLKVALATVHMPLRRAAESLNTHDIVRVATVTDAALRQDFAIARPRIALAGLNPHAGEGGALGREEIEIINPAAAALRARGIAATDAQPPDTLFHEEARAGYDAVIAMYHDQGLIPLKTVHFWNAVNITLGLPIVRTSPDHGTAFDIAGRNLARADSFIAALRLADEIAARRVSLAVSLGAA